VGVGSNYPFLTSKERDNETGLDYFGARNHSSLQGRFITTDPALTSAEKTNPQTWNRYTYVLNNPINLVDPLGLQDTTAELARRLREQHQNQTVTTTNVPVTEVQLRPRIPTDQEIRLIHLATLNQGPLTQTMLTNADQAIQDALGMVAAPQTGVNSCRDALLRNFGPVDPTTALQEIQTSGGAARMGPDGIVTGPQNVFNGNTTVETGIVDGQTVSIAQFLRNESTVRAVTAGNTIYLDDSFNNQSRIDRAGTMIHEGVVHRSGANNRRDSEFAPANSRNPREAGSNRINEIIRINCNRLRN
jgi:RHS repeat-associated protein